MVKSQGYHTIKCLEQEDVETVSNSWCTLKGHDKAIMNPNQKNRLGHLPVNTIEWTMETLRFGCCSRRWWIGWGWVYFQVYETECPIRAHCITEYVFGCFFVCFLFSRFLHVALGLPDPTTPRRSAMTTASKWSRERPPSPLWKPCLGAWPRQPRPHPPWVSLSCQQAVRMNTGARPLPYMVVCQPCLSSVTWCIRRSSEPSTCRVSFTERFERASGNAKWLWFRIIFQQQTDERMNQCMKIHIRCMKIPHEVIWVRIARCTQMLSQANIFFFNCTTVQSTETLPSNPRWRYKHAQWLHISGWGEKIIFIQFYRSTHRHTHSHMQNISWCIFSQKNLRLAGTNSELFDIPFTMCSFCRRCFFAWR